MSSSQTTLLDGNGFPSPLALFLFQVVFITSLSRVLIFLLAKVRQPAVIAEMIAGILLGPSALSRIPGFGTILFPAASLRIIQVISQFGLVLFMFLVGLELDASEFKDNFKQVSVIAGVGVLIPCVIAVPMTLLVDDPKFSNSGFGDLALFNGVAIGMSALPVLARILAEHNMLASRLGQLIMGATAIDDVFAWCLLAIVVAVARASNEINILYVFLAAFANLLFVVFIVRPCLNRLCRDVETKTQVTPIIFFAIIAVLLAVAYITEAIGLSSLIGAFQVGLVVPRKRALVSNLTQKLEDLIIVILMPLFFTNSGLRTNFFLLNTGEDWGICIYLIVIATASKVLGVFIPSRCFGLNNRDAAAFGVLMSCKGLVGLVVINFGLDYGIITPKYFSILVVMVLITSILTVPLTELILPLKTFHAPAVLDITVQSPDGRPSLAVGIIEPLNMKPLSPLRSTRARSIPAKQTVTFAALTTGGCPVSLGEESQVVIRVLVCATSIHSNSLISLANALITKRSGDEIITASQCITYRPIGPGEYTYTHSLAALTDRDDVMKGLMERAEVHRLEVQFLPVPVPASEVVSQVLGIAYSQQSDILLLNSTFSSDLKEADDASGHSLSNLLITSCCVTGVYVDSKGTWPLADARTVLLVLVPGVHGAAALRLAQVMACNGTVVSALSISSMPHGHAVPENIKQIEETESPKEDGDMAIEMSRSIFPGANDVLKAVENESRQASYSLVIVPDLFIPPTPLTPVAPRKSYARSATNDGLAQVSAFGPVLFVRAPGDASVRGSFAYASLLGH